MTRRSLALLLVFFVLAPLYCRRAEGVAADPGEKEAEEALLGYLRIDTSNPPGNETAGAKYLQQLLVKEGIPAQLVGSDPARQSVYARLASGTNEKALLLLHHIDVVPAARDEWTKPPFAGVRSGGYLWGRGALDIKSLGIANLMAIADLKRRNVKLGRDVIFLGVADEELGGLKGCGELLEKHPELFANVGYVLNEGGYNETVVDHVTFWGIEIQQKVPLWLRLKAKGTGGHASAPPDDGGALAKLVRVLAKIDTVETPYRLSPDVARSFAEIGRVRKDGRGAIIRSVAEPIDVAKVTKDLGPGYRALLHDTIAITRVGGGAAVNSVPARASADVDIRLLPDAAPDAMLAKVRELAGNDVEVEVLLAGAPTPESPADTDLFRLLDKTLRAKEPGSVVAPVVVQGTTDSRFFRTRGIAAYGIAPFKVNYYDADSVHAADERIRVRFFAEGVRLMRQIVRDFCGESSAGNLPAGPPPTRRPQVDSAVR